MPPHTSTYHHVHPQCHTLCTSLCYTHSHTPSTPCTHPNVTHHVHPHYHTHYTNYSTGNYALPISCLLSPRKERSIRDPNEHFIASLKLEMYENRTSHVAPMIAIVRLRDDEQFDSKHPEAFTYETIGGNHSRIALQQLLNENDNLRQDPQFSSWRVSVYSRMTNEQAQHLALRHNRATDFTCKMTTQEKV